MLARLFSLFLAIALLAGCSTSLDAYPWQTLSGEPPIIIAHRGNSGNYPEHTLGAYESAMLLGADYVEPDVVMTKDAVLVCRHDLYLSTTTDVASLPSFAGRKRKLGEREDWFARDFTLAELKELRAVQPRDDRPLQLGNRYHVPTLAELFELAARHQARTDQPVNLYIEVKKPKEHIGMGFDQIAALMAVLDKFAETDNAPGVILQCFDPETTAELARSDYPVVYLSNSPIDFDKLPEGVAGLGLNKKLIEVIDGRSELIEEAHRRGLLVHAWTFRDDQLGGTGFDAGQAEIEAYL
ncbi:MAG: glycerophosphodiester phosphodiesterase family protein, partial [Planctomycetota bacterium]